MSVDMSQSRSGTEKDGSFGVSRKYVRPPNLRYKVFVNFEYAM
jgi:hypothetical protein